MARHRYFQAAAQRGAMDGHDDGFGAILDLLQQAVQFGRGAMAGSGLLQFLDVRPGNERAARAQDHDGADGIVFFNRGNRIGDSVGHSQTQRVHGRIIHRDY